MVDSLLSGAIMSALPELSLRVLLHLPPCMRLHPRVLPSPLELLLSAATASSRLPPYQQIQCQGTSAGATDPSPDPWKLGACSPKPHLLQPCAGGQGPNGAATSCACPWWLTS